jgi:taurine dioxygenase
MLMSALKVRRIGYALGAEVTGVDLNQRVDDETFAAIRKAWIENIVLVFPGQDLELEPMKLFCERFGKLNEFRIDPTISHPEHPSVRIIVNQAMTVNGKEYSGRFNRDRGATRWHTDQSHTLHPAEGSFLLAKNIPEVGGDTMFANMYMAYETLSPKMQELLGQLSSVHDQTMFVSGTPEQMALERERFPAVVHPAVTVHPESGRKALFVNPRVRRFVGLTEEEGRPLLDFLIRHAVAYEFCYRHRWTVNDLVIWDNRCSLHIAVQDYDQSQLRRMQRCQSIAPRAGYLYEGEENASARPENAAVASAAT